jgi:cell division septation protein DedD
MHRRPLGPVAIVATALLAAMTVGGCARDAAEWQAAQAADTPEAYAAFIDRHPGSSQVAAARARSSQLAEQRAWDIATQADTAESYRRFMGAYPAGDWAQEARVRIANFELAAVAAAPVERAAVAAPVDTPALRPAVRAPDVAPPAARASAPAPAPVPARPTPSAPGSARVQLGAFSSRDKAESDWRRLAQRFTEVAALAPDYVEAEVGGARVVRLQADVPDAASADALCGQLKAARQGCMRVPKR